MLLNVCGAHAGGSLSVVYCSVSDSSLYVDVCEDCQTSSTEDTYTVAIVGGVVAIVIMSIITALRIIVVEALSKRHFGNYSTGAQSKYVISIYMKPGYENSYEQEK